MLDAEWSHSFGTIERPESLKDFSAANAPRSDIGLGRDNTPRSTERSVNLGKLTDAQLRVDYIP